MIGGPIPSVQARSRSLPAAVARELVATVRTGLWPLSRLVPLPEAAAGAAPRPPVVLVHGFLANAEMMRPLARRLLEHGWTRVERVAWSSARDDLEAIAARVGEIARAAAADGPVDLVGHSLGGVAARLWLKQSDGARYVRRFVSLAAPHGGTSLYRLAPPRLRAALDPRGGSVARLAQGPEPVPTVVIRARWDHQVLPHTRATIPGVPEIVVDAGHNGVLWSKDAHDAVMAALLAP